MEMRVDLSGTFVLVHPELLTDPAGKQNHVGVIAAADLRNDDIFVGFEDKRQALYASDALLMLKPVGEIHQHLVDNAYTLALPDLKALTQIDLMLRFGSEKNTMVPIALAQQNPAIHLFCLEPLKDFLDRGQAQSFQR